MAPSALISALHNISNHHSLLIHKVLQHTLLTKLRDTQQEHLSQAIYHRAMVPPSQTIQDHILKLRLINGRSKHFRRAKQHLNHLLTPVINPMEPRRHPINSISHIPLRQAQASNDTVKLLSGRQHMHKLRRTIRYIASTTRIVVQLSMITRWWTPMQHPLKLSSSRPPLSHRRGIHPPAPHTTVDQAINQSSTWHGMIGTLISTVPSGPRATSPWIQTLAWESLYGILRSK